MFQGHSQDFSKENPNQSGLDLSSFINDNRSAFEIRHYFTRDEKDVYEEWRRQLRDTKVKIAVDRRINRMELGNLAITNSVGTESGDCVSTWARAIGSITPLPDPS